MPSASAALLSEWRRAAHFARAFREGGNQMSLPVSLRDTVGGHTRENSELLNDQLSHVRVTSESPGTSVGWGYRASSTVTRGPVWAGAEAPAASTSPPLRAAGTGRASQPRETRRTALPLAGQHRLGCWQPAPVPSRLSPPSKCGHCRPAGNWALAACAALHLRII